MNFKTIILGAAAALSLTTGVHAQDSVAMHDPIPASAPADARVLIQWWFHEKRLCARKLHDECFLADELEVALNHRGWYTDGKTWGR
jgi:hypothetical protein